MNFNSHTDVVVRVAVDLVNLLTPGEERGRRYAPPEADERTAAVGAVLRGAGGREATWEEAASLCFVAAELRGVFEAVSTGAVDEAAGQVNALLVRTGARPELERHDGEPWHLHFHAADRSLPNGWAAGCATGLAVVLGGDLVRPARRVHGAPVRPGSTSTPRATAPGGTARPRARTGSRPPRSGLAWHEPGGCTLEVPSGGGLKRE